jgi:hypothetical protein
MSEIDVERMKAAFATLASIEMPVDRSTQVESEDSEAQADDQAGLERRCLRLRDQAGHALMDCSRAGYREQVGIF